MTSNDSGAVGQSAARASAAIEKLGGAHGELADVLANVTAIVAEEALENAGFRARLSDVLVGDRTRQQEAPPLEATAAPAPSGVPTRARPRKTRRAPGPWDPYTVYADVGETGLRDRLSGLEIAQLQDIIAEHGMNNDGLAMKWKKVDRLVGRIAERVVDRAAKGDAFRTA